MENTILEKDAQSRRTEINPRSQTMRPVGPLLTKAMLRSLPLNMNCVE